MFLRKNLAIKLRLQGNKMKKIILVSAWVFLYAFDGQAYGFIVRNSSESEQEIAMKFQSRVVISDRNIGELSPPRGYSFVINGQETRESIKIDPLVSGERKNIDLVLHRILRIPKMHEHKIEVPFDLTKSVEFFINQENLKIDLSSLYFIGSIKFGIPDTRAGAIEVYMDRPLELEKQKIESLFHFSRDHYKSYEPAEGDQEEIQRDQVGVMRSIYGKDDSDALEGINYLEKSTLSIIDSFSWCSLEDEPIAAEIPKITHRIWLTNRVDPVEPPSEQIERYIQSVSLLNLSPGWTHRFWCWENTDIPLTCDLLRKSGQNIEICDLSRYLQTNRLLGEHLFFAAYDDSLHTVAANILRCNLLLKHGGVYADIGVEFLHDFTPLLSHCDIIAHHTLGKKEPPSYWIDENFIASIPGHPVLNRFLSKINELYKYKENPSLRAHFKFARLMHMWTNARFLTECFQLFSKSSESRAFIIPNGIIFRMNHMSSWYGKTTKYGVHSIGDTRLNWFDVRPDYTAECPILSGFNAGAYQKYFAPGLTTYNELAHDWMSQGLGVRRLQKTPLVVTLTSWPGTVHKTYLTIESLLRQSMKPDHLVLWLAREEFPGQKIPSILDGLVARGLQIHWCENIRSAKKLIPALRDPFFRNCVCVTADDDIIYQPHWLKNLVLGHRDFPRDIIAHRARMILSENGRLKNYHSWPLCKSAEIPDHAILFPTTGGGVLYPPQCLHPEVLNTDNFMKLCQKGDDIWFFTMAKLAGTKIRLSATPSADFIDLNDGATRATSLWSANRLGGNDVMIQATFSHYGIRF